MEKSVLVFVAERAQGTPGRGGSEPQQLLSDSGCGRCPLNELHISPIICFQSPTRASARCPSLSDEPMLDSQGTSRKPGEMRK